MSSRRNGQADNKYRPATVHLPASSSSFKNVLASIRAVQGVWCYRWEGLVAPCDEYLAPYDLGCCCCAVSSVLSVFVEDLKELSYGASFNYASLYTIPFARVLECNA
ncbi:hypothetical protein E2C01_049502 [Portunus trituberculatus]|uniref:Uncharacterized protein n=1 Tax=Portunus trituberculatus TaxID=210409 RepID=A0A5B7G5R3_PORTR|nr:hypothetical protein [Portunus trituberculatus]